MYFNINLSYFLNVQYLEMTQLILIRRLGNILLSSNRLRVIMVESITAWSWS